MRKLMLIASVAAMAVATPALAQGRGHGQGHGARNGQVARTMPAPRARVRTDVQTSTDWQRGRNRARGAVVDRNRDGIDDRAQSRRFVDRNGDGIDDRTQSRRFVDRNGDGIDDRTQSRRFVDRNGDGIDDRTQTPRYGGAACPPGLATRNPPCVPPGQARRMFREGQRIPESYRYYTDYDALIGRVPEAYRSQIPTGYRYIYRDDAVYVVDPATRLVRDIIDLID